MPHHRLFILCSHFYYFICFLFILLQLIFFVCVSSLLTRMCEPILPYDSRKWRSGIDFYQFAAFLGLNIISTLTVRIPLHSSFLSNFLPSFSLSLSHPDVLSVSPFLFSHFLAYFSSLLLWLPLFLPSHYLTFLSSVLSFSFSLSLSFVLSLT